MVDQAQQVNGNGRGGETPPRAVARSAGELVHDLVTLAELQGRLALVDARDGVNRLMLAAAMVVAGVLIALGCIPIALAALALLLVETTTLTQVQAFGIALAIGVVLAGLLVGIGLYVLRQRSNMFERSRAEWQQNLRWAKDALGKVSRGSPLPPASY
jgi:hypothetical protein